MSDLGEYYQEKRNKEQAEREQQRIWNTDVVMGLSIEFDFKVIKHTDYHFSLYHPSRGRFDFFPSTCKGGWKNGNGCRGKPFQISDIEAFLNLHFKKQS